MARMIPSHFDEDTPSYGEKQVFEALKNLPEDYTVFHSVRWNKRNRNNMMESGESDFTIFHPDYGILVIEVKGGGVEYRNGRWYYLRSDSDGLIPMKNPLQQADKSKYQFMNLLDDLLIDEEDGYCRIESAVWFPAVNKHNIPGTLPMEFHDEIVLDEYSLSHPLESIQQVYRFYNSFNGTRLPQSSVDKIISAFAPYYRAMPSLKSNWLQQEEIFIRLTKEQQYLLDYLEEQQNAAIQGAAGTGKTLLAVEKAKRLSESGRVLFLCFNQFLRLHLQNLKQQDPGSYENIDFYNLPQLACMRMGRREVDQEDIETFLERFDSYNWPYSHIVIDEGQDFTNRQIELLQEISLLTEGAFYVFYDKKQFVQGLSFPDWLLNAECRLILHTNCRNTLKIAKTSGKPVKMESKVRTKGVKGDMPNFIICKDLKNLQKQISLRLDAYTKSGIPYDQICILTLKTESTSCLSGLERIGKYELSSSRNPGKILFTTARKFKGLESDVILLVDLEQSDMAEEENRRLFYVGASRAKHYLDIFYQGDDQSMLQLATELSVTKTMYPNGRMGIARALDVKPVIAKE